jgi:predicted 2-oxoglutarate/Fe(II)-dependent dioxygenase YbiX
MLTYNTDMNSNGEKNVHWDFSFMTFVGCLSENFDGGVLFFPRQNVNYKLKMGDIIVFPGGITHPHYVTKVTEGQRNVLIGQSFNIVDGGLKPLI